MADSKITALAALTAADPASDMFPVVDVSDTSMAASGTTKRISVNNILSSSPTASGALTVTGLVTAGSATITGAATVGTTLGVTGASTLASANISGLLGVGTVSPSGSFKATLSGLYGLRIQSADTNNSALNIGNDPTSGYAFIDATKTGSGSFLPLRISTSDTERLRIEAAGDVKIVTGNVVMGTSGKGIDFTATANSSGTMTSELLNDYEEGTWTATVTGTTIAGSATYPAQTGQYTKIGRTVFLNLYLEWNSHTGTGNMSITGLPFTNSSAASAYSAGSIGFFDNISLTAANIPFIHITPGFSVITLRQMASGGGANSAIPMDAAGGMIVNISYNV